MIILELVQIARIALLKPAVGDSEASRSGIASLDEVAGDVDAQYVRAESRRRQRRGSVAASEVQNLEPFANPKLTDERRPALSHGRGDPGEIALFPQGLVRIGRGDNVSGHYFLHVSCLNGAHSDGLRLPVD